MTTATKTATYTNGNGKNVELTITATRGTYNDEGTTDGVAQYSIERAHSRDTIDVAIDGEHKLTTEYQVHDLSNDPAASKLRDAGYVAAMFDGGRPLLGFTAEQYEAVKEAHESAVAEAKQDAAYADLMDRVRRSDDEAAEYEASHDAIERVRTQGN